MLTQQKEATYTLVSSIVFIILKAVILPIRGQFKSEGILLLLAMFIFTLWIGRAIFRARFTALDEMEKTIRYQAALTATHGFGAVVMVFALILYLTHRATQSVPLPQVLGMAYYGWISLYVFWSGSILALYRTGGIRV